MRYEISQDRDVESRQTLRKLLTFGFFAALTLWAIFSLFPLYVMVTSSFTKIGGDFGIEDVQIFPLEPTFSNYVGLLKTIGHVFLLWIWNSLLIAVIPTATKLIFDAMAGYSLAKMRFPGRNLIFWSILSSLMIPYFVTLIPLYKMMFDFAWIDTYWALLFPGLAGVGGVFLFKQYMSTLPSSIIDAARVDACSEFRIFWKIILPMSKPALAVMGIFSFMGSWNLYFWPYLVTNMRKMYTLQVGLVSLMGVESASGGQTREYGLIMAGAVLASLLPIAIFLAFQKYFVKGITIGALKG